MNLNTALCAIIALSTLNYTQANYLSKNATTAMFKALESICKEQRDIDATVECFNSNSFVKEFKQCLPSEQLYALILDIENEHYHQKGNGFEVHNHYCPWPQAVVSEAAERFFALHHAPQILQHNKNSINAISDAVAREQLIRELVWQEFIAVEHLYGINC